MSPRISEPKTTALPQILDKLVGEVDKVLLFSSGPDLLVRKAIDSLQAWKPNLSITIYCHSGREIAGFENLIYPYPGYFRFELADLHQLREYCFDLALIPYATDRRLHPDYNELDRIASAVGAWAVLAYYFDGTVLLLDSKLLERKEKLVVNPYLKQKNRAIGEICAFTGESPLLVEDKCNLAYLRASRLWEERRPESAEAIDRFYRENDFYIYGLMKECDWRGARFDTAELVCKELEPGSSVLDYGGGCGTTALFLARRGFRLAHLDLPGRLLDFAEFRFQRRRLNIKVLKAEKKYPLREAYDSIVCTHVLEHLPDPEGKLRHLAEHLNPGGKLILSIPFEPNPVAGVHPNLHLNRLAPERYARLMEELGFGTPLHKGELDIFQHPAA
ncbi:MAG: hypothetical protein A3F83_13235 [Candidatus Glassbacteria bacterium RIFCSPLOWO2_12_FULL_58_11]|uniref:Methyltransferase type 11 domain-containing protein n=2 Tax=Candidatus Glassiibacteriota TaxID=1817805 RepID=A0A1F5YTJ6_9BACT|nr:MAG: hypothetical protein A2Z86_04690 [Candidatus Glassbacteria bacterium GWA2_58_10]OGG03434.1 MAG: hypothetical protein A3F83_13235 [Candidatus Glassbacteria bacterium RIFCSPLOWO2_12_FULL_58_11]